jgi:hypothetical protein
LCATAIKCVLMFIAKKLIFKWSIQSHKLYCYKIWSFAQTGYYIIRFLMQGVTDVTEIMYV